MTLLYPKLCYTNVRYKGTILYLVLMLVSINFDLISLHAPIIAR